MKLPFFRYLLPSAVLLASLMGGLASAQNEKKGPRGWLRILPLGEAPPFRQVIANGVRQEVAARPGTIPPRKVTLPPVGKNAAPEVRLSLDNMTPPVVAKAGRVPFFEGGFVAGDEAEAKPWHSVIMPARSAALVLLWRDPAEKSWKKARSIVLPDDVTAFPAGSVRVVNVSPFTVAVQIGTKGFQLKPGAKVMQGGRGVVLKNAPLKVAIPDGKGGWDVVWNAPLNQNNGFRTNVVIYRADGEKPRRLAKVRVIPERAAMPKLPKEGEQAAVNN